MEPEGRPFAHPVPAVVVCLAGLLVTWAVAVLDPVPSWERSMTNWINSAPEWTADALYPVMQFGTLWAPIGLAVAVVLLGLSSSGPFRRASWFVALTIVVAGLIAWLAAKGVKQLVGRQRPVAYLPDIDIREGEGTGLGFVSGHSAVAAAMGTVLFFVVPRWARPLLVVGMLLVGVARVVYGVHLVADVVGGWAVGVVVGLVIVELSTRLAPPHG